MTVPQAQDAHAAALGRATPIVVTPAGSDEPILVLHPDGRLDVREGAGSEAARLFVDDVYRMWRWALPEPELRLADALSVARSRIAVLERALVEIRDYRGNRCAQSQIAARALRDGLGL